MSHRQRYQFLSIFGVAPTPNNSVHNLILPRNSPTQCKISDYAYLPIRLIRLISQSQRTKQELREFNVSNLTLLHPKSNPLFYKSVAVILLFGLLQEVDSAVFCYGGLKEYWVEQLYQSEVADSPVKRFQFLVLGQSIKRRGVLLFSYTQFFTRS